MSLSDSEYVTIDKDIRNTGFFLNIYLLAFN